MSLWAEQINLESVMDVVQEVVAWVTWQEIKRVPVRRVAEVGTAKYGPGVDPTAWTKLGSSERHLRIVTGRGWHWDHGGCIKHQLVPLLCPTRLYSLPSSHISPQPHPLLLQLRFCTQPWQVGARHAIPQGTTSLVLGPASWTLNPSSGGWPRYRCWTSSCSPRCCSPPCVHPLTCSFLMDVVNLANQFVTSSSLQPLTSAILPTSILSAANLQWLRLFCLWLWSRLVIYRKTGNPLQN